MKAEKIISCFIGVGFMITLPLCTWANNGKRLLHIPIGYSVKLSIDTLPQNVMVADNANKKPVEDIIKEVPKARRQAVPIPIPVKVQVKPPIIIIKQKIIQPVIRILH